MPIQNRRGSISASLLAVLSLMLAACTTVESQSFRAAKNSRVESAKIAADADFSKYDRLLIDDMGIYFPTSAPVPDSDLQHIRDIFRDAFSAELKGYEYTREPGPGMLRVRATLIDLRHATPMDEIPNLRRELKEIAKPGALVFLMELRDSGTNEVLARAADSAEAPRFAYADDNSTDWKTVEVAAAHWAMLFREFLDRSFE